MKWLFNTVGSAVMVWLLILFFCAQCTSIHAQEADPQPIHLANGGWDDVQWCKPYFPRRVHVSECQQAVVARQRESQPQLNQWAAQMRDCTMTGAIYREAIEYRDSGASVQQAYDAMRVAGAYPASHWRGNFEFLMTVVEQVYNNDEFVNAPPDALAQDVTNVCMHDLQARVSVQ